MKIPFYHVDAFASKIFAGNPAMVCVLEQWLPENILQQIANENYLPATAFLVKTGEDYQTRWFTPEYEIDLCGHGSLASAYVIFNIIEPARHKVKLKYTAGELEITNQNGHLTMQLPAKAVESFDSPILVKGLGARPKEIYQYKSERCLCIFETEDEVRQLKPDISILRELEHRGIIISATGKQCDFVSRTFYPNKSAWEDAVTGSSHCLLVPYWSRRLNKLALHTWQVSHRGGELYCEMLNNQISISGNAMLYANGTINL